MGVLPTCMPVHPVCAVLLEARRRDTVDLELQTVVSLHVVLGLIPGSLQEQPVLLLLIHPSSP